MPRGNDSLAASAELAARYNVGGNAEDLIQSGRMRRDPLLRKASLLGEDPEAKDELGTSGAAKETGLKEDEILDFTVRGDYIVVVREDGRGDLYKEAFSRKGTQAAKEDVPEESEEEKLEREHHEGEARRVKAAREAREKHASDAAKAEEKAVAAQEKAVADADKKS